MIEHDLAWIVGWLVTALIAARWAMELLLGWLNQRHVQAHTREVPESFREFIDPATYARSVDYTLAKIRFARFEDTYSAVVLLVVLFSGVLSWSFGLFTGWAGGSNWSLAAWLLLVGVALSIPSLPVEWCAQFRLEQRFGFNTSSQGTWWLDRAKGLMLVAVLGYPLLALILKLVEWIGELWWLWAWGAIVASQCTMLLLAPVVILPLFNKFTPLPEGTLRDRLLDLARRTGFEARGIQVMDGSKRSKHSNAFFTGLGRFRRIVLFDTLVAQLTGPELEAVLAHEIGHFKKKHVLKMLAGSLVSLLAGLWVVAWLAGKEWFLEDFGFAAGQVAPALLLFAMLGGCITFWFSPLANRWSRRFEYQADAFAAQAAGTAEALISALRKLTEENLTNLTPHPLYSGFYYSHPTLLEREQRLRATILATG